MQINNELRANLINMLENGWAFRGYYKSGKMDAGELNGESHLVTAEDFDSGVLDKYAGLALVLRHCDGDLVCIDDDNRDSEVTGRINDLCDLSIGKTVEIYRDNGKGKKRLYIDDRDNKRRATLGKIDVITTDKRVNFIGVKDDGIAYQLSGLDLFDVTPDELPVFEDWHFESLRSISGLDKQDVYKEDNIHDFMTKEVTVRIGRGDSIISVRDFIQKHPKYIEAENDIERCKRHSESIEDELMRIIRNQINFILKDRSTAETLYRSWSGKDQITIIPASTQKEFNYIPLEDKSLLHYMYYEIKELSPIHDSGLAMYIAMNFIGTLLATTYTLDGGNVDSAFLMLLMGATGSGKSSAIKLHSKLLDAFYRKAHEINGNSPSIDLKLLSLRKIGVVKEEISSCRGLRERVHNTPVLCIQEDEFSDYLKKGNSKGAELLSELLRLKTDYKNETYKYTTSGEKSVYSIWAYSPIVSGYFGLQPYFAQKYLTEDYHLKGYGNRFLALAIKGKKKRVYPIYKESQVITGCLEYLYRTLDFEFSDRIAIKRSDEQKYLKKYVEAQGNKPEVREYWSTNRGFVRKDMNYMADAKQWLYENSDDDLLAEYLDGDAHDRITHAYFQRAQMTIKSLALVYAYADRLFSEFGNEPVIRIRDLEKAKAFFFNSTQYALSYQGVEETDGNDEYNDFMKVLCAINPETKILNRNILSKKLQRDKRFPASVRNELLIMGCDRGDLELIKGKDIIARGAQFKVTYNKGE